MTSRLRRVLDRADCNRRTTRWFVALLLAGLMGCAHGSAGRSVSPKAGTTPWIDAPLLGPTPDEEEWLGQLGRGDARARIVRLDRLLDRFDAARFAQDPAGRELLWTALGGHSSGRGEVATREALTRLLDEALAVEALAEPGGEDDQQFTADLIMLLSADLEWPQTADDLSIRLLALRQLLATGHPRIADNARWRLYEHARGVLSAATAMPSAERPAIAIEALYVKQERFTALPWPAVDELWGVATEPRDALAANPAWKPVVAVRESGDLALHETLAASLPAFRDPAWPIPSRPSGTGRPESLAPVVWLAEGAATVDAGRPQARRVELATDLEGRDAELVNALQSVLALDGRGTLLLAIAPTTPAPDLHTLLRGIRRAQTARLELAMREPRVDDEGEVVVALPVQVVRSVESTHGAVAVQTARLSVHLTGRGPQFAMDGRVLAMPSSDRETAALAQRLAHAFPRERIVRLTLAPDIAFPQLLDLTVVLEGGTEPAFEAVGWWVDGSSSTETGGDTALALREALRFVRPQLAIEGEDAIHVADRPHVRGYAMRLFACLPELEARLPGDKLRVEVTFVEGRVGAVALPGVRGPARARVDAFVRCALDEALSVRLAEGANPKIVATLANLPI